MITKKSPILILAPHTDDGEFGCGASIAKFIEEGAEVYYAAFSVCEESVPEGWPKDILEREVKAATQALGIKEECLLLYKYKVRHFYHRRQDILEDLVLLQRKIKPQLVFMPTVRDLHQDHQVVANEGLRAFKQTTILAYEMPWNNIQFSTQTFIKLEKRHLQTKINALHKYESQKHRPYASEKFISSMACMRGVSIGTEFAEAFEVVRWIIS